MSKEGFGPSHDPSKYTWENDVNGGGFFVFTATESNLVHKILDELKVRSVHMPLFPRNRDSL